MAGPSGGHCRAAGSSIDPPARPPRKGITEYVIDTGEPLLAVHGDLDISVIREKPANRQEVTTAAVPDTRVDEVMNAVARAVERGIVAAALVGDVTLGRFRLYMSLAWFALAALVLALVWFLYRSRAGLVLRSVGESPESAHALGYPVRRIRLAAVVAGGALCGLAGAYLSVIYTPLWVEGMVAGKGWIALALTT